MGGEGVPPVIRHINKATIHRICSGQVILGLSSAVKELVENSLDAGATSIEVNLKDYGEAYFKVIDNGSGISPSNFKALALKHHTSKILDFSDLLSLSTFGFRGEALSSLCALGKLTVETRTLNEQVGAHLEFDHSGSLTMESKVARQVGTTVTVEHLFSSLPVRKKEFSRNIRREFGKLVSLLNAYAIIAKGVRFLCTNCSGKNAKSLVLKTQGSRSLKDNIITVFGISTFQCLQPLNIDIGEGCSVEGFISKPGMGSGRNIGDRQYFYVNGRPVDLPKVSKIINELYRSANSKQYPVAILDFCVPMTSFDVNVTPDKRKIFLSSEGAVMNSLREAIEKIYSPQRCTFSVNCIEDPQQEVQEESTSSDDSAGESELSPGVGGCTDVMRVSDDLPSDNHQRSNLKSDVASFGAAVTEGCLLKDSAPQYDKLDGFPGNIRNPGISSDKSSGLLPFHHQLSNNKLDADLKSEHERTSRTGHILKSYSGFAQPSLTKYISVNKRKHEDACCPLPETPVLRKRTCSVSYGRTVSETSISSPGTRAGSIPEFDSISEDRNNSLPQRCSELDVNTQPVCSDDLKEQYADSGENGLPAMDSDVSKDQEAVRKTSLGKSESQINELCSSEPSSAYLSYPPLRFSLVELRKSRQLKLSLLHSSKLPNQIRNTVRLFTAATLNNSQFECKNEKEHSLAAAASELDRLFQKENFKQMQVVGQFNLGFIIAKLDHDLFIIDQHAADEKYNFEKLSQTTILNVQPLLQPIRLELSPEEEVVASMHLKTLRKNGFVLSEDANAQTGRHFLLRAMPFSKNVVFGPEDVKELISTLADDQGDCSIISSYKMESADSICPSKVRSMLASRACRQSIMVGDSLTRTQMERILQNLAELRSPWNCPHGRPTMRHLADLTSIKKPRSGITNVLT